MTAHGVDVEGAVAAFKLRVRNAVNDAMAALRDETGIGPSALSVRLVEITAQEDRVRRYVVGEVSVEFRL